ncbi:unnamed protein product [Caenorhabditis brenneri]
MNTSHHPYTPSEVSSTIKDNAETAGLIGGCRQAFLDSDDNDTLIFRSLSSLEEYKIFVPHSIKTCVMYDETNREIGWKKLDEFFEYQHNTCQPL